MVTIIQPNCRAQFTSEDMDFVVSVLTPASDRVQSLVRLFTDPDSLDVILDDDMIFRALLENAVCLRVSKQFYFYILVRHVLRRSGIDDRAVADYVAELLAEFSLAERARNPLPEGSQPMDYLVDMLAAIEKSDERTRFLIRAHVGNHSLFLSGVFPERVHFRAQFRGAPEMEYYESLGSANFRVAGDHRLAQQLELTPIFSRLAEQFHAIRLALNDMTDRIISLGDGSTILPQTSSSQAD